MFYIALLFFISYYYNSDCIVRYIFYFNKNTHSIEDIDSKGSIHPIFKKKKYKNDDNDNDNDDDDDESFNKCFLGQYSFVCVHRCQYETDMDRSFIAASPFVEAFDTAIKAYMKNGKLSIRRNNTVVLYSRVVMCAVRLFRKIHLANFCRENGSKKQSRYFTNDDCFFFNRNM